MTPRIIALVVASATIAVTATVGFVVVNVLASAGFQTYENDAYNVRLKYPSNWTAEE